MMKTSILGIFAASAMSIVGFTSAMAAEADSCKAVHFADVGWTDITATTATASVILEALGYSPDVQVLSVPVTYTSLKNKDIDVFLGNWMPTMEGDLKPYREDGSVESVRANLEGAKYTLATNAKGAEIGIKDFADIAKHSDRRHVIGPVAKDLTQRAICRRQIVAHQRGRRAPDERVVVGCEYRTHFGLGRRRVVADDPERRAEPAIGFRIRRIGLDGAPGLLGDLPCLLLGHGFSGLLHRVGGFPGHVRIRPARMPAGRHHL